MALVFLDLYGRRRHSLCVLVFLCILGIALGRPPSTNPTVLAHLIDGRVVGMGASNGEVRWTIHTGKPLIASSASLGPRIVPSADGSLYALQGAGEADPLALEDSHVQKLPVTVWQLAMSDPRPTRDGGIILGSTNTSVLAVDPETGEIKMELGDGSQGLHKGIKGSDLSPSGTLMLSRRDFQVSAVDARTGEARWNASFGYITPTHFQLTGGDALVQDAEWFEEHGGGYSFRVMDDMHIVRIANDGTEMWRTKFGALPLAVTDFHGRTLGSLTPSLEADGSCIREDSSQEKRVKLVQSYSGFCAIPESYYAGVGRPGQRAWNPRLARLKPGSGSLSRLPAIGRVASEASDATWSNSKATPTVAAVLVIVSTSGIAAFCYMSLRVQKGISSVTATPLQSRCMDDEDFASSLKNAQEGGDDDDNEEEGGEDGVVNDGEDQAWTPIGSALLVGRTILGRGSMGTVVFDGKFQGRDVAVKRLVSEYHQLAENEVEALLRSDVHPNVIRHFAYFRRGGFTYLALERCEWTLDSLIEGTDASSCRLSLWGRGQKPTPECLGILHDAARGLEYLHSLGLCHRDIKPSNVLVHSDGRAVLGDFGLCKRLHGEDTSWASGGTLGGTSGWQAPERIRGEKQTTAVDVFGLGLVYHYALTRGQHAFGGERALRDARALEGPPDLGALAHLPETRHLLRSMMAGDPLHRPCASRILGHLLWWGADMRLAFLVDLSDRMEMEDREADDGLLRKFEGGVSEALGGDWTTMVSEELMENLGRYRKYQGRSVRDLLRVIRNKRHHFAELPHALQNELGSVPDGFLRYFTTRFPRLMLYAYCFAEANFASEPVFSKYFSLSSGETFQPRSARGETPVDFAPGDVSKPPEDTFGEAWRRAIQEAPRKEQPHTFPRRPARKVCDFYMKTGRCKFGMQCKFDHPPR